ncbi:uncharacterized protein LOC111060832 isoform X2 [Nilaparvata lugens]|nr:uncharacterized protein LOC111060832 isoform X2 [Nilaparvata lugens]
MGSMWCKPSQFTDDCSPKLNIHSILSRLSSQICPSRCRYSHTGGRAHTKQRPRNEAVSKGCRPVISHPLMQPVPPPRKKRKHIQDLSRSDEHLCSSHKASSTPLRAANSLPVLCVPITQLKIANNHEPLESITEEAMPSIMREMEDMESLPISEVYFLRKDGNKSSPVFDAITKDIAEKTMTMDIAGITNMANSNFLDRSNSCAQIRIDTEVIERITDKRKEIIETDTVTRIIDKKSRVGTILVEENAQRSQPNMRNLDKDKIQKSQRNITVMVVDGIQRSAPNGINMPVYNMRRSETNVTKNVEKGIESVIMINNIVTRTDVDSYDNNSGNGGVDSVIDGKKRQDAMKSKWLQNILIGSDASENHVISVHDIGTIPSFIPQDIRDDQKSSSQNINEAQETQDIAGDTKLIENSEERVSRLIVTPQCLSEKLKELNASKQTRDEIFNSRNLVLNSQNSTLKVDDCSPTNLSSHMNWLSVGGQNDGRKDSSKNSDGSRKSSRRSSITDSLQEFESSIYEMLQESAKANASDEDDSFIALHKQALVGRQGT